MFWLHDTITMNYTPISNLKLGKVEQIFLVSDVSAYSGKNNNPYIIITLQDVTGRIKCSVWNCDFSKVSDWITKGKYIFINGEVKLYKNEFVISSRIESVSPFNGEPENTDIYISGINENETKVYIDEIDSCISRIDDPHLRDIIQYAISSTDLKSLLSKSPYGLHGNFAYRGGLLSFVYFMLKFIDSQTKNINQLIYEDGISYSLLVVSILLKYIGWHEAVDMEVRKIIPNNKYKLLGIEYLSLSFIQKIINECVATFDTNSIPINKQLALLNTCMSNPFTIEGKLIKNIEECVHLLSSSRDEVKTAEIGSEWAGEIFRGHYVR